MAASTIDRAPGPGVGPAAGPASTTPTGPAGRPAVEAVGVTKAYRGQQVLHGVSLSIAQGEIFGILGSNGAGKTTAVEIVQGIRSRDAGTVRVLGLDPATERGRLRHLVGAQLQSSALPDRLRVGEALRLFARLAGDVVDWRTLRDDWTLGHLERRPFAALSGGERQRLFLALALVNQPRVVFLDELTQGLDVAARRETWDHVEHVRDQGTTVVLVTHFMDEAERLCDRLGVLHGGHIVATGRPAELVAATGGAVRLGFTIADASTPAAVMTGVERIPGVATARPTGRPGAWEIACAADAVVPVIGELAARGLAADDLTVTRPSLEDAFVALTRATDATQPEATEGEDR